VRLIRLGSELITRILDGRESLPGDALTDTAVALGAFDGVHLGHRALIDAVRRARDERGLALSCLFTFRHHPRSVLDADRPRLLTSWSEKLALLQETGVDAVVAADFCPALAALPYDEFVRRFLRGLLGMRYLAGGHDVHLGAGRGGSADSLTDLARRDGFGFEVVPPLTLGDEVVSSSAIRRLLREGEVARAADMLGRPYSLWGEVGYGAGRGATLGYPTANVEPLDPDKQLPAPGVYAVWVHVPTDAVAGDDRRAVVGLRHGHLPEVDRHGDLLGAPGTERAVCRGMLNFGLAPTVNPGGLPRPRLEVHVLDFHGYVRERSLKLEWVARLRDERTFPSVEALRGQLARDETAARAALDPETLNRRGG
jgi:riboflavin kinase/FMN adenylyltransferase